MRELTRSEEPTRLRTCGFGSLEACRRREASTRIISPSRVVIRYPQRAATSTPLERPRRHSSDHALPCARPRPPARRRRPAPPPAPAVALHAPNSPLVRTAWRSPAARRLRRGLGRPSTLKSLVLVGHETHDVAGAPRRSRPRASPGRAPRWLATPGYGIHQPSWGSVAKAARAASVSSPGRIADGG